MAAGLIGASVLLGGSQARAEVDYDGIKYLGGGDKIDLNNANIRAYLKVPGIYPTVAGKIVTNGAFPLARPSPPWLFTLSTRTLPLCILLQSTLF